MQESLHDSTMIAQSLWSSDKIFTSREGDMGAEPLFPPESYQWFKLTKFGILGIWC